jgi:murein DD-endopeptidase MepM/ murein hydrolase activator NlpD
VVGSTGLKPVPHLHFSLYFLIPSCQQKLAHQKIKDKTENKWSVISDQLSVKAKSKAKAGEVKGISALGGWFGST